MRLAFFLFALFFLPMSLLQATTSSEQINRDALLTFAKEWDASILEHTTKRVYFNPDRLLFSVDGMFIQTDSGTLCPISNVSFTAGVGYYQEPRPMKVRCSNCGYRYPAHYSHCPNCGTPQ